MICASEIFIIIQRAEVWHLARHDPECMNVCDSIPPGFQRGFYTCWNPKGSICRVFRNYKLVRFCETLFWYNFGKYNEEINLKKKILAIMQRLYTRTFLVFLQLFDGMRSSRMHRLGLSMIFSNAKEVR